MRGVLVYVGILTNRVESRQLGISMHVVVLNRVDCERLHLPRGGDENCPSCAAAVR